MKKGLMVLILAAAIGIAAYQITRTHQQSERKEVLLDATDSALMSRLAAGDDLALNILMTRWSGRVVGFIYRMTGRHETAVDLAQETFVKLYQARTRYRPQDSFSTYLFAIAVNLARNRLRWWRRRPTVELQEWSAAEGAGTEETREAGASALERAERAAAVQAAIAALPRELREAIVLFEYERLSQAEIAAIVGVTSKAVETRIYRAREKLRAALQAWA